MNTDDSVVGPMNLGNPTESTMRELAEAVIAVTGSSSRIEYRPLPKDDPRQRCPDIEYARATLGWTPKVPLLEGLRKTAEYFDGLLSAGVDVGRR
jgi:UDP-glucuronate decarboxylase